MYRLSFFLRWCWVLSIALFAPVSLPAGGATNYQCLTRSDFKDSKYFAGTSCILLSSPTITSHSLRKLPLGTPLHVLRSWKGDDGNNWFQVQVYLNRFIELPINITRGWIKV